MFLADNIFLSSRQGWHKPAEAMKMAVWLMDKVTSFAYLPATSKANCGRRFIPTSDPSEHLRVVVIIVFKFY
jgi:hypothetical protein